MKVSLLKLILTIIAYFAKFFSDKQLIDLGKAKEQLEGKERTDEIKSRINVGIDDPRVRQHVREKYTKK